MTDADFLVSCAVRSVFFSALVLVMLLAFRGRSPQTRSNLGHAGLLTLLLLPAVSLLFPSMDLAVPSGFGSYLVSPTQAVVGAGGSYVRDLSQGDQRFLALSLLIWSIPAMLLFARLSVSIAGLSRMRSRAEVISDPSWLRALDRAQARMGPRKGVALLVSDEVSSPVSWGLIRPTIVINRALVSKSDCAEAVISHELAHVANFDWMKLLVARSAVAVYWFNPLVWFIARETDHSIEEVADDAVLRAGVSADEYSSLLVNAVRHNVKRLSAVHGVAPSRGSLYSRVARVLGTEVSRVGPSRWTSVAISGTVAATGLVVGLASLVPMTPLTANVAEAVAVPAPELRPARSGVQVQQEVQVETPVVERQEVQVEKGGRGHPPKFASVERTQDGGTRQTRMAADLGSGSLEP